MAYIQHTLYILSPLSEDFSDNEEVLPKEITKWNSNDLMDKIEAADTEESPGMMKTTSWTETSSSEPGVKVCVCR